MMTKEFNLEMAKNGAAIQTKLGNPVKFNCITNDNKLFVTVFKRSRIVGGDHKAIAPSFGGTQDKYCLNGRKYAGTTTMFDLEMVEPYNVGQPRDAKGRFIKK